MHFFATAFTISIIIKSISIIISQVPQPTCMHGFGEPDTIRIVIIIFKINVTITITCEPGSIDIIRSLIFRARTQENSVAIRRK